MDVSNQQQQQPSQDLSYDSSQSQSYAAYYAYYHHHHQQQHHHQAYDLSAYHHHQQQYYDYSATQTYPLPDPAAAAGAADPSQIQPQKQAAPEADMNPAAAAAVAALSQLSQFAGSMDAAEKAMAERQWHENGGSQPMPYQYPPQHFPMEYGGGRRGGGSFRGGGRRGGGSFRGGGRGRGRMGHGGGNGHVVEQSTAPGGMYQPPPPVLVMPKLSLAWCDICRVECNSLEILEQHKNGKRHKKTEQRYEEMQKQQKLFAELQANAMPHVMLPNFVTAQSVSSVPVPMLSTSVAAQSVSSIPDNIPTAPVAQDSVTTPSVLLTTQQASGAKLAPANAEAATEVPQVAASVSQEPLTSATEVPQVAAYVSQEPLTSATEVPQVAASVSQEPLTGATEVPQVAASVVPPVPVELATGPSRPDFTSRFATKRGGTKRKMTKYGRGGKKMKFEPVRERPRVCTICNVMCKTPAVFETHLAGKKHISKIKRFQGPGSVYGPVTVYIPPNQPSAYPTQGQDPIFYGLKSHEMIQRETFMALNGSGGSGPKVIGGVVAAPNIDIQDAPLQFEPSGLVPAAPKTDTKLETETSINGTENVLPVLQGPGSVYGPVTVYIPPNQPSTYPTQGQDPIFYGLKSHVMIQQETLMVLNGSGGSGPKVIEGVVAAPNIDIQDAPLQFEPRGDSPAAPKTDTKLETETSVNGTENVLPVPDAAAVPGDEVVPPSDDAKVEQPGENAEENKDGAKMST